MQCCKASTLCCICDTKRLVFSIAIEMLDGSVRLTIAVLLERCYESRRSTNDARYCNDSHHN